MADRERQVRAVQGVEVEVRNPFGGEDPALLPGHHCRHELAPLRIVLEGLEQSGQPGRHASPAEAREAGDLAVVGHRQDPWDQRRFDAGPADPIAEAKKQLRVEEELGDGAARPRVQLAFEVVDVELRARGVRVHFGVGGDRDLEVGDAAKPGHEIDRVVVAAGMRLVAGPGLGRVAAQGHDVPDSGRVVGACHLVHLLAGGTDAREMGGGGEGGLREDPAHRGVGPVAGAAARPVGDGHEPRIERGEAQDGAPERSFHLLRPGREELERHPDALHSGEPQREDAQPLGEGRDFRMSCHCVRHVDLQGVCAGGAPNPSCGSDHRTVQRGWPAEGSRQPGRVRSSVAFSGVCVKTYSAIHFHTCERR